MKLNCINWKLYALSTCDIIGAFIILADGCNFEHFLKLFLGKLSVLVHIHGPVVPEERIVPSSEIEQNFLVHLPVNIRLLQHVSQNKNGF